MCSTVSSDVRGLPSTRHFSKASKAPLNWSISRYFYSIRTSRIMFNAHNWLELGMPWHFLRILVNRFHLTEWLTNQSRNVNTTAQLIMHIGNHCDTSAARDRWEGNLRGFCILQYKRHDNIYRVDRYIKFWNVLTMVCNTQNYWVFRLCPSSGIQKTREHNISETGSVSVLT
jgi:hypothetical protein